MRDFGRSGNEFWDASWHLFAGRPVLTCHIYTEFLLKINKQTNKQTKKRSEKRFDVNTRFPRRAWWEFRDVLDEILFLYLQFDMNKYLQNWGNYRYCKVLGDLLFLLWFIYWRFMGSWFMALQWFYTRVWIFAVLTVSYLQ